MMLRRRTHDHHCMELYRHHADPDDTEEHICLTANTAGSLSKANLFTNAPVVVGL